MAFVTLDSNANITGIFANPQPQLGGYAVIDDGDPRIAAFSSGILGVAAAKIALAKTDDVAIRCLKAGVAFPSEWLAYVQTLRKIVTAGSGTAPAQPSYPVGT